MFNLKQLGLVLLLSLLTGCGAVSTTDEAAQEPYTVTVFAAASLTEAFADMGSAFEAANSNSAVEFNFAGSQTLRLQLEQGAQADVFASANQRHAEALLDAGLIAEPILFTQNQLVIILPKENPANIETLADLTQPGVKLVLAGPDVPVGGYAREALEKLNSHPDLSATYAQQVLENLVSEEENVKAVVAKVRLGEADAGIVYTSDVTTDVADELRQLPLPLEYNVIATYPIAAVSDAPQPEAAQAFIAFILSSEGQNILAKHGFMPVQASQAMTQ